MNVVENRLSAFQLASQNRLWIRGDGTTTTTTSTSTNHTYATAGNRILTVIVTDNNGNEKRVKTLLGARHRSR